MLGNVNGSGQVLNESGATMTVAPGTSATNTVDVPITNDKGGILEVISGTLSVSSLANDGTLDVDSSTSR